MSYTFVSQPRIRENISVHMAEVKAWLREAEGLPLESMDGFFDARIADYEEHMELFRGGYKVFTTLIPEGARDILDLGCGTGLELESILRLRPELTVTGVDMSRAMLKKLNEKLPAIKTVCMDYFRYDMGLSRWDAVISFESLHHFKPDIKARLFGRIYASLKEGGVFLNGDYIACCGEEEAMLSDFCDRKRSAEGIPAGAFVHFDTPLTLEHELSLLSAAGFKRAGPLGCANGVCVVAAEK